MKNFIAADDVVTLTTSVAVSAGDPVQIGSVFGIAENNAPAGGQVEIRRRGAVTLPAATADVIGEGVDIYWKNGKATIDSTGSWIGMASRSKSAGVTTAAVILSGRVGVPGVVSGGATLTWRASSLAASPIAGPINAFGVLSPLSTLLIPAGTLVAGQSQIRGKVRFLRTGSAATMVPAMYVGNVNSVSSNAMSDSTLATSGTVGCIDYVVDVTSATTLTSWWQIDRVGNTSGNVLNFTTKFDVATDTYITFGVNPINAADTCSLLSYDIQVFR